MSNIRSFGDFFEDRNNQPFSFAGGHKSAIGVEDGGHTVHLYEGGFTVNDGPFRSLEDPRNALFLSSVKSGIAPPELQDQGKEVRVFFIDESHKKYEAPKSRATPTESRKSAQSTNEVLEVAWDTNSGSSTTLRLKLHNNTRINLTVSQETTLGEIRSFIANQSGIPECAFRILSGFPPREVKGNDTDTLRTADLLGCALIQKAVS